MSYILDALNKSEQERQNKKAPNLKTSHNNPPEASGNRSGLWPGIILLLAILLCILVYVNFDRLTQHQPPQRTKSNSPGTLSSREQSSVNHVNQAAALATSDGDIGKINQQPGEETSRQAAKIELAVTNALTSPDSGNKISKENEQIALAKAVIFTNIGMEDLPAGILKQLPDLTFSTHIYAEESSWRMVGINGKSRKEGDLVDGRLRLLEITEEGVIFGYDDFIFSRSVVRDWSSQ